VFGVYDTTEHRAMRASLSKFIDQEINPHVDEWEKARAFPAHELFKKMGKLGFLGVNRPVSFCEREGKEGDCFGS
jgi:citronellyl-CoA dehydrogenase